MAINPLSDHQTRLKMAENGLIIDTTGQIIEYVLPIEDCFRYHFADQHKAQIVGNFSTRSKNLNNARGEIQECSAQ